MISDKTGKLSTTVDISAKIRDYVQLSKLRLSLVVVFSAGMSYLIGLDGSANWGHFAALLAGGLLFAAGANAVNEVLEQRWDAMMARTATRPIPAGRMDSREAIGFAIITCLAGGLLMGLVISWVCALIGLASFLLYGFVYTPLKRVHSSAVLVGAIPGALPTVIGWYAAHPSWYTASGHLHPAPWILFAIQFYWQLPHFYAIAWLAWDEYARAGYFLLPFAGKRNRTSALWVLASCAVLLPLAWVPVFFGLAGNVATIVMALLALVFMAEAVLLIRKLDRRSALLIMFTSFLYLPAVLITILLDKQ